MLNVERLRVLHALASAGSVRGAAESLHVTTSAVSQQLARLEREVGQCLLERHGRGVRLTDAGTLLAEHAGALLVQLNLIEADLARHRGAVAGELTVAAFATAARGLLPDALRALRQRYPALRVRCDEQEPDVAANAVHHGDVDLAVVQDWADAPLDLPDALARATLFDDAFDVALAIDHPLAARRTIELPELADEDWVTWPAGQLCHDWLAHTMPAALISHTASDHSTQLALVAAGLGIALIPRLGRDPVPAGVRFVAVSPAPVRRVHAIWRASTTRHPALKAVLTALREAAADAQLPVRNATTRNAAVTAAGDAGVGR
jgi:DNA-binding transcriptional LysR family regulator